MAVFLFSFFTLVSLILLLVVKLFRIKHYEHTKRTGGQPLAEDDYLLQTDQSLRLKNIEADKLLYKNIRPNERILWIWERPSHFIRAVLGCSIASLGLAVLGVVASILSYVLQPSKDIDLYIIVVYVFLFAGWLACAIASLIRKPTTHAAYALTSQRAVIIGLSRPSCVSANVEEEFLEYTFRELQSVHVEREQKDKGSIVFKNQLMGDLSVATGFFDIPDVDSVAALIKQQVVNQRLSFRENSINNKTRDRYNKLYMANSLPPEVWCHILSYVRDFDEVVTTKRINRLFFNEMRDKDPLLTAPDINWGVVKDVIKYLSHRKIFSADRKQVLEYWQSHQVSDVLRDAENLLDDAKRYFVFKTLLMSAHMVQKTAAIYETYRRAEPYPINHATQFYTKLLNDDDSVYTKLFVWDIESSETFEQICPTYLNFANAILFTFKVQDRESIKILIERCLRVIGTYYSRRPTVPPLMYLVGIGNSDEKNRVGKLSELASKVFHLKYFEIIDCSSSAVTDMMNSITDDMQKAAAGKWFAEMQGLNVLQTALPAPKKMCNLL